MSEVKLFLISDACEVLGVDETFIVHCIQAEWIQPFSRKTMEFDEEDIARLQLIRELKEDFGANEESIPLILHLLDQIYTLRRKIYHLQDRFNQSNDRESA